MKIRLANDQDIKAIQNIYNYEVINGSATLDLQEKTYEEMGEWVHAHNVGHFYLYVAEIEGEVAGYASLSSYRAKEAYKSTVELSIYIKNEWKQHGIATVLMKTLIDRARQDDSIHLIVSVITSGNKASEILHKKFGFTYCGTIHEVGYKMGKFQDIDNWELKTND